MLHLCFCWHDPHTINSTFCQVARKVVICCADHLMSEPEYIRDLTDAVKKKIVSILDVRHPPNWRSLMEAIGYRASFITQVGMATLTPGGSPTSTLLKDLAQEGRTVHELINWLLSLPGRSTALQTVVDELRGAPVITQNLQVKVSVSAGQDVKLQCGASGSQPLHYQWFKRRDVLHGKTESVLLLQNVTQEHEGYYLCRVANQFGFVFTGWAKIIVNGGQGDAFQRFDFPIITCQSGPVVSATLGSRFSLYCDGVGRPAPSFQWYKNNMAIAGAEIRELTRYPATVEDEAVYFCKVYNSVGEISSEPIQVKITDVPTTNMQVRGVSVSGPSDIERVANKVALLIGNKDYQHAQQLGKLFHPINDVCDLTGGLLNMNGFKVVSLVNLTLAEMREALRQFCSLLVEETYAVFYFAGHGFERRGHSYLMPVDATERYHPHENMASSEILKAMQETKAKLNVVLLDGCRSEPEPDPGLLLQGGDIQDIKEPNVVLAFACCPQSCVFECPEERNGFFAKHLLKNITDEHRNKSIEEVLLGVSRGIYGEGLADPFTSQKQVVNRITTLVKPMTLWCPVDNNLMNPFTAAAIERWQSAHEIPNKPVTVFGAENGRIKVELSFNAEVSNVLIVNARALGDKELDSTVKFDMGGVVSGCGVERNSEFGKKCPPWEATLKVKDLQRLTEPLVLKLTVMYIVNGERIQNSVTYTMEEKPLYAKLVTAW